MRESSAYECIVVDIEGTTTSIAFVHDVLFPYASTQAHAFIAANWQNQSLIAPLLAGLAELAEQDGGPHLALHDASLSRKKRAAAISTYSSYVLSLIKADRKVAALKNLQGVIWKGAYESGKVKGHLFDDVVPVLEKWSSLNIPVYIYSSGSVAAQKLLFGFSDKGNILRHFSGHFDTAIGSKLESESYTKIATTVNVDPKKILFLSDSVKEIAAADRAEFQTCILARPGNAPLIPEPVDGRYTLSASATIAVCTDFNQVFENFEHSTITKSIDKKRKAAESSEIAVNSAVEIENAGWNGVAAVKITPHVNYIQDETTINTSESKQSNGPVLAEDNIVSENVDISVQTLTSKYPTRKREADNDNNAIANSITEIAPSASKKSKKSKKEEKEKEKRRIDDIRGIEDKKVEQTTEKAVEIKPSATTSSSEKSKYVAIAASLSKIKLPQKGSVDKQLQKKVATPKAKQVAEVIISETSEFAKKDKKNVTLTETHKGKSDSASKQSISTPANKKKRSTTS
ncbi:hypothetical protein HK100_011430 [Physocladia obscura]|uniref:2,3-diketo-5-methylthio-1-phosphopentane phosphatase n=1 Tax=Physocladia obscura TaxID=109957 RepID=A0AAD5T1F2_9FUNG|nr:hypothetical protein HK100_011430 [Physocladia obscura]